MDNPVTTILALCTPVVQVLLMGIIGYSWARGKPNRMPVFYRSGFYWWGIALFVIVLAAVALPPHQIPVKSLAGNDWSLIRFLTSIILGFLAAIAIEFTYEFLASRFGTTDVPRSRQKYEAALPPALRRHRLEVMALAIVGGLEETVYRGIALAGLLSWAGLSEPLACAISSVAFGFGHLYFGVSQLLIKSALGGVFCALALAAGWPAAFIAHATLNVVLISIGNHARSTGD